MTKLMGLLNIRFVVMSILAFCLFTTMVSADGQKPQNHFTIPTVKTTSDTNQMVGPEVKKTDDKKDEINQAGNTITVKNRLNGKTTTYPILTMEMVGGKTIRVFKADNLSAQGPMADAPRYGLSRFLFFEIRQMTSDGKLTAQMKPGEEYHLHEPGYIPVDAIGKKLDEQSKQIFLSFVQNDLQRQFDRQGKLVASSKKGSNKKVTKDSTEKTAKASTPKKNKKTAIAKNNSQPKANPKANQNATATPKPSKPEIQPSISIAANTANLVGPATLKIQVTKNVKGEYRISDNGKEIAGYTGNIAQIENLAPGKHEITAKLVSSGAPSNVLNFEVAAPAKPVINKFELEKATSKNGEKNKVMWNITGASLVTLNGKPVNAKEGNQEFTVEPFKTFDLIAYAGDKDYGITDKKTITLTIKLPQETALSINKAEVSQGDNGVTANVKLSKSGAVELFIDGQSAAKGESKTDYDLKATALKPGNHSWKLVAKNGNEETAVEGKLDIKNVEPPPPATSGTTNQQQPVNIDNEAKTVVFILGPIVIALFAFMFWRQRQLNKRLAAAKARSASYTATPTSQGQDPMDTGKLIT